MTLSSRSVLKRMKEACVELSVQKRVNSTTNFSRPFVPYISVIDEIVFFLDWGRFESALSSRCSVDALNTPRGAFFPIYLPVFEASAGNRLFYEAYNAVFNSRAGITGLFNRTTNYFTSFQS